MEWMPVCLGFYNLKPIPLPFVFFLYQGEFVNDKRICILAIPKDITAMRAYRD